MAKTLVRVLLTLSLVLLLTAPATASDDRFQGTEQIGGTTVIKYVCEGTPPTFQISASYDGNEFGRLAAQFGEAYHVILDTPGVVLNKNSGWAASPREIDIINHLPQGFIDAHFYINGEKVATKFKLVPTQKATFGLKCVPKPKL